MSEQDGNLYLAMVARVRDVMMYLEGGRDFLIAPVIFFVASSEAIEAMGQELGIEKAANPADVIEIGPISIQVTKALNGRVAYAVPNPHKASRIFERWWF